MAQFPTSFLEDIKRRVPLTDVISRYATVQRRGSKLLACCPFHNEKTPSFYIYEEDGHYHCYGCKAHGDLFSFLMEKKGLTFPEVVEELAHQAGLPLPKDPEQDTKGLPRDLKERYYEIMEQAAQFYEKMLRSNSGAGALRYLEERGILPQTIKTFRLGYASSSKALSQYLASKGYALVDLEALGLVKKSREGGNQDAYDTFRHRLIFPITDPQNRVIGFGGRLLGPGEPKYLNSPETPLFHKGNIVYGYSVVRALKSQKDPIICCEGYVDVLALYQHAFKAVAPLGTSITENQLRLLWRLDTEPIICLDGDVAGESAALRALSTALPLLQAGYSLRFVGLPAGEDPDSLLKKGKKEVLQNLFNHPVPLVDKLWDTTIAKHPARTPEQKAALRKVLYEHLGHIHDVSVRKSYEFEINERLRSYFQQKTRHESGHRPLAPGPRPRANPKILLQLDVNEVQLRILFACILNHPDLLQYVEQEFLDFDFGNTIYNTLREEIIRYIMDGQELDTQALQSHLYKKGYEIIIKSICSDTTYMHGRFCLPSEPLVSVLENWQKVGQFYQNRRNLEQEIKRAEERLRDVYTIDNLNFLKNLQQELMVLRQSAFTLKEDT